MMSNIEPGELQCTVAVERLNAAGQATKRQYIRKATVILGRNEFHEIVMRVHDGKAPQSFMLRDFQLFTRFAKDGKCTVKFAPENTQVLISDCPPDRLKMFLKTLNIKYQASQSSKPMSDRAKIRAGLPRAFETISPLQLKDVQKANELRSKVNAPVQLKGPAERSVNRILGERQQVKRPRPDCDTSPVKALHPNKKPALVLPVAQKLSREQTAVLNAVLGGKNVFFTGSAGTGKSFLLKRIVGSLPPKSTYATASTGVAACHIGGTTLHNFAGIGSGSASLEQCLELAQRPGVLQHWTTCKHLIIDEISMVEAEFFDKLEAIARSIRRSTEPFGGIQLIVCGDFLQLPPVTKGKDKPNFCFQSRSWRKCIHMNMELTEVRRQTDKTFISLLQAVRVGRVTEEVTAQLLKSAYHCIERDGILATRLCTHKDDVELTNENKLKQLPEFDRCSSVTDSSTASENNHYGDDMTTADTPSHTRQPSVENRQTRRPSIKGTVTEVTSMLSSMIDQQKQYFELFATGEEERHRRELELERERFRLQIELEDRRRQTQMEHDQAMLRMMAQVISASTHTAPSQTPFPAPIYTPEHSTTLHQLTPAHHSNQGFAVYNQEDSTDAASQVPLSSVLHEINKFK